MQRRSQRFLFGSLNKTIKKENRKNNNSSIERMAFFLYLNISMVIGLINSRKHFPAIMTEKVVALWDYNSEKPDELSIEEDDVILVLKSEEGWMYGDLNGTCGWFPANLVEKFDDKAQKKLVMHQSSSSLISPAGQRKRWSEIHEDLSGLPKEEIARQEVIRELFLTEADYVRDLKVIIKLMYDLKKLALVSPKDISVLFSNIEQILPINQELLKNLQDKINANAVVDHIGDIFLQISDYLKIYTMYCSNHPYAVIKYQSISSKQFQKFLENCKLLPECRQMELSSFLIKPVQRICKYPLLIRELIKNTNEQHPDRQDLEKAAVKIDTVVTIVNEAARKTESIRKMLELQSNISNKIVIMSPSRTLVSESTVSVIQKGKKKSRKIYLFNDLILITKQRMLNDKEHVDAFMPMGSIQHKLVGEQQVEVIHGKVTYVLDFGSESMTRKWVELLVKQTGLERHCNPPEVDLKKGQIDLGDVREKYRNAKESKGHKFTQSAQFNHAEQKSTHSEQISDISSIESDDRLTPLSQATTPTKSPMRRSLPALPKTAKSAPESPVKFEMSTPIRKVIEAMIFEEENDEEGLNEESVKETNEDFNRIGESNVSQSLPTTPKKASLPTPQSISPAKYESGKTLNRNTQKGDTVNRKSQKGDTLTRDAHKTEFRKPPTPVSAEEVKQEASTQETKKEKSDTKKDNTKHKLPAVPKFEKKGIERNLNSICVRYKAQRPSLAQATHSINTPIKRVEILDVFRQANTKKDYIYVIQVIRQSQTKIIFCTFEDFFDFHMQLLGHFPEESGMKGHERIIPDLPSQIMFVSESLAIARIKMLQEYLDAVLSLPFKISRSFVVFSFLKEDGKRIASFLPVQSHRVKPQITSRRT